MGQIKTENVIITILFTITLGLFLYSEFTGVDWGWFYITLPITLLPLIGSAVAILWIVKKFLYNIAYYELRLLFEKIINN